MRDITGTSDKVQMGYCIKHMQQYVIWNSGTRCPNCEKEKVGVTIYLRR